MLAGIGLALGVPSPASADGLVDNVAGLTLDAQGQLVRFTGFTVTADGRIGQVFTAREKRPKHSDWRMDGKGRVVIPGLIDAHAHLIPTGLALMTLDLSDAATLAEAQNRIRAYAARYPDRPWIIGFGWNQERWQLGRMPSTAELDAAVADRPVWLKRADGHAGWANSAAWKAAGLTAHSPAPPGGRIEGGVFVDAAMALMEPAVPQPLGKERDLALLAAQEQLIPLGITSVTDMGTTLDDWQALRRAGDDGRLNLRVLSYAWGIEPMVSIAAGAPTPWLYQDRLRLVGVKLVLDGALGSRGACLKAPYADAPSQSGLCLMDDIRLRNLMSRAAMDRFQIALHAIGDRANLQAIEAIEELSQRYEGDRRWRIEHAQIIDPADLNRFTAYGIIASMQPLHAVNDRQMAQARLGPARLTGAYAWKSLAERGVPLAFGSDTPVEPANPFAGMAAAISREDAQGAPPGGWQPEQRVTALQAFAAYTVGAARAAFAEDRLGRIAPGFRADFLVIDRDPFTASAPELRQMRVIESWINGQQVFPRGPKK